MITAAATTTDPGASRDVEMALIYPNAKQPRKEFPAAALAELAESIRASGLIEPIVLVERPGPLGRYMIVAGERRFRAHALLGRETIHAIIRELTDDEVADLAIIENMARLDISPLEEAYAFRARLDTIEAGGVSPADAIDVLAGRLGVKQPFRISDRVALLRLTPTNLEALRVGALTPSQAFEMSKLTPALQRVLFDAIAERKVNSLPQLRATTQALLEAEAQATLPVFGMGCALPVAESGGGIRPSPIAVTSSGAVASTPDLGGAPSTVEVARARGITARIASAEALLREGFDGNDAVILRKVHVLEADVLADKLAVMEASLSKLRLALRAASVVHGAGLIPTAASIAPEAVVVDRDLKPDNVSPAPTAPAPTVARARRVRTPEELSEAARKAHRTRAANRAAAAAVSVSA